MSQFEQFRFFSSNYMATDYLKTLANTRFGQRFKPPRKIIQDFIQRSIANSRTRYLDSIWNPPSLKQEIIYGQLIYSNGHWSIRPNYLTEPFELQRHPIDESFFGPSTKHSQPLSAEPWTNFVSQGAYSHGQDTLSETSSGTFFEFEEAEGDGYEQVCGET